MELKEQIKQQLKKIPEAVVVGGSMKAAQWKQKASKAHEIISKSNVSKVDLETLLYELRNFK